VTVAQQTPYSRYAGNGVTTVFPYTFKILDEEDLTVYVDGEIQTLNVNYSVSGVGDAGGGEITFLTGAPASPLSVSIIRLMVVERSTDYQLQGDFNSNTVNPDFDRPVMLLQDVHTQLNRSIRLPVDEVDTIPTLPSITERAGKFITFDVDGQPAVSDGTGADGSLRSDLAATDTGDEGAALVGTGYPASGAIALSLQSYIDDDGAYQVMGFVPQNLKSAIRDATSTADVSDYLQLAIDAADDEGVGAIRFRAGLFNIEQALTLARGINYLGANRLRSIIQVVGAINGLTFAGSIGNAYGAATVMRDLYVRGSATSLALVALTTGGGQIDFYNNLFHLSGTSLLSLADNTHRVGLYGNLFQSWTNYAIDATSGLNSVLTALGNQGNIVGADAITPAAGSAFIGWGESVNLICAGNNVNGDDTLAHLVRFTEDCGGLLILGGYCERLIGPAIISDSGIVIDGAHILGPELSCVNSAAIDLSAGNPVHLGIHVENVRRPETGAVFVFNPGTGIRDFEYKGSKVDGSCDHVVGYAGQSHVRKYADATLHLGSATRSSVGPFTFENVAGTTGNTDMNGTRWVAPRAGRVTAVVVKATEARTAGTLTVNVFKATGLSGAAGSAMGVSADLDGTNTISMATTTNQVDPTRAFAAGDELYLRYSTSGWTPTTSDIRAFIEVEM
jgi:hypothetical protein